jgi:hypothetical protein
VLSEVGVMMLTFHGLSLAFLWSSFSPALADPEVPELLAPADGAVLGPEVKFEALVRDSEGGDLEVGVYLRPKIEALEPFRVAILPDTQFYTMEDSIAETGDVFGDQVRWILDEASTSNTVFVSHMGDVVQDWDDEEQWAVASAAMSQLDGVLPYAIAWGNHDIPRDDEGPWPEVLPLDTAFPLSDLESQGWWGGNHPEQKTWHSWQTVSVGGLDLLFVHLMFEPELEDQAWAASVIEAHPDHFVIISTHSLVLPGGELVHEYTFDGTELWDNLVTPYDNVRLVLSGHVASDGFTSRVVAAQPVYGLLSCFHVEGSRGDGFLRLLDFDPEDSRLRVSTYSPTLHQWREDSSNQFEIHLPLAPLDWWTLQADVRSDSTMASEWPNPRHGTWEWWVRVQDARGRSARSEVRSFTVDERAPIMDDLRVSVLGSSAVRLAWTTDEPATSLVELGRGADHGQLVSSTDPVIEHLVEIDGLEPGASYRFRASTMDTVGNTSRALTGSFVLETDSTPPQPHDSAEHDTGLPCAHCTEEHGCSAGPRGARLGALTLAAALPLRRRRRVSA